eukprot:GEMP01044420.1.p1 GENE.GEMP01044420.1~~GEMP01044420.1.p1  ORF type:complete len:333 (+),score=58.53 GEMP01044420.1:26-1024(+)
MRVPLIVGLILLFIGIEIVSLVLLQDIYFRRLRGGQRAQQDFGNDEEDAPSPNHGWRLIKPVKNPVFDSSGDVSFAEPTWPAYWILTAPMNEHTRCIEILESWAKNVPPDSLVFYGAALDLKINGYKFVSCREANFTDKAKKEMLGWRYMYDHFPGRDWYVKADDDTYFLVDNLHRYLESLDSSLPYFLGRKFHFLGPGGLQYVSGGGGYVLSRAALELLIAGSQNCIDSFVRPGMDGDLVIGECTQSVGIFPEDTRDVRGRERFHPFEFGQHVSSVSLLAPWYSRYSFGPVAEGLDCCGFFSTISFHYMSTKMRSFVWPPKALEHIPVDKT